jgi:hypothetical protein
MNNNELVTQKSLSNRAFIIIRAFTTLSLIRRTWAFPANQGINNTTAGWMRDLVYRRSIYHLAH